jgi:hypothetical protein
VPVGTAATISSSTSIAAGDRSSWRPPWFETTIVSTPCSTARRASSPVRIPFRTNGSGDHERIVASESHVRFFAIHWSTVSASSASPASVPSSPSAA